MRTWLLNSLLLALLGSTLGGCSREEEQVRRELLRPIDIRKKRVVEREKKRYVDAAGELIPSDQVVAGITLPKGLKLYRSFEREWYLEAKRIDVGQLERYFAPRLDPLAVERNDSLVSFVDAHLRNDPSARKVTVRLSRLIGSETVTDVYIRQMPAKRVFQPERVAESQLKARRLRAE